MSQTHVIADIGACHDADPQKMKAAIAAARFAGCDAIKFQLTSDPVRMAARRGRATADGYADVYRRFLAFPQEWLPWLRAACDAAGIGFLCTVFLPEDVAAVAPYVERFKIASFEAGDRGMLLAHVPYEQQTIVSTGLMDEAAVRELVITASGILPGMKILHCVSAYPTPVEQLHLGVLRGDAIFDGLSDHTAPELTWTGALAVAAGARIIEAHLRLDHTDPSNPDYPHAMTPWQFAEYVQHIRFAEQALGSGEKRVQPCEAAMARYRVGV